MTADCTSSSYKLYITGTVTERMIYQVTHVVFMGLHLSHVDSQKKTDLVQLSLMNLIRFTVW